MVAIANGPKLGDGVYTFTEAARILRAFDQSVTVRQLRHWTDTDLVLPIYQTDDELPILTFDDLISLEVIRRFRNEGTSLQRIRKLEDAMRSHFPSLLKPFAYRRFYTDGASVWAEEIGETGPIVVELLGKRRHNYAWADAIRTFGSEAKC